LRLTNKQIASIQNQTNNRFANTCVEDKEGLGEWHEPENKENGEEEQAVEE